MKKRWLLLMPLLLLPLGYHSWTISGPTVATPLRLQVEAQSVDLAPLSAQTPRVGALTYMGGVALRSEGRNFGGLSGLVWLGKGQMLAVSDRGELVRWQIHMQGQKPVQVKDVEIFPLRDTQGKIGRKVERDSEALLFDTAHAQLLISTEHLNRIYRYSLQNPNAPALEMHEIPDTHNWQSNGGAESLARLPDGRLVVISEEPPAGAKTSIGLIFATNQGKKPPKRFAYHPPSGFSPTDAVVVDDTWMLVLHRHFSLLEGVRANIGLVRIADMLAGGDVYPQSIAQLDRPMAIDNMEGMALERTDGRLYLWLVSDDNFNPLQRTLLMRFLWDGPPKD